DRRNHRFLGLRPSRVRGGDVLHPRGGARPDAHHALQQRLPPGAAARQLPAAGRLHRAAARAAGAGEPHGAPADAGRGARRLRGAHHRGDPALRLRALGQEGRAPHLHRRPAGRRHARGRRRHPGADDGPARPAGARLLLGARRPPQRGAGARGALPPAGARQHRGGLTRPRQRQGGDGVRPQPGPARRRRLQAARGRRPRGHRPHRRGRAGQGRHRARRRDRHRRLDRRAAPGAAPRGRPADLHRLHPRAVHRPRDRTAQ
ncbi:MAG: Ribose-phosphate pyrophosphokinase, partial [uncultured Friedmanniella sp.]